MATCQIGSSTNTHTSSNKRESVSPEEKLAGDKLGLSMRKDAKYPQAWSELMAKMPETTLVQIIDGMTSDENEFRAAGDLFLKFARKLNKDALRREQAQQGAGEVGAGDAAEEARILKQRRAEHLKNLQALATAINRQ